jgi:hypothetical protein
MPFKRARDALLLMLLLATGARAQLDWGADRQLFAGPLGQYGIAADRTAGPDTAFVGLIARGPNGDTVKVLRSCDRGENWQELWSTAQRDHYYSNLALRVCGAPTGWVIVMWLDRDSLNNGNIAGARIAPDGSAAFPLEPVTPSRDTITWLALTRSFDSLPAIYAFWQDEAGLAGVNRAPVIRMARSSDLGESWTAPLDVLTGFETPAADHGAPDHLYLAARSLSCADISAAFSTDQGRNWTVTRLTSDSLANNDMFPSVAATHDSGAGERVWVSYDTHRERSWDVRYAYTANAGALWVLDRELAGSSGNEFFSSLDCAGRGSRRVRAVYLSDADSTYRVQYRSCEGTNPANWSDPLIISDSIATIAMAPAATCYGISSDTLNQGLVFYAQPGPMNLWYDAGQFEGVTEPGSAADPLPAHLTARIIRGELEVDIPRLNSGRLELSLYASDGRRRGRASGYYQPGAIRLRVPVTGLANGSYLLVLRCGNGTVATKIIAVR